MVEGQGEGLMKYPKKLSAFAAATGVICFFVGASRAAQPPSQTSQAPSAEAQSLTATVGAVDTKARTLEMITGVGHALWVVRMQVEPTCHITVAGTAGQLGDLKRGNIVRIQYRKAAERNLAEYIETVRLAHPGDKR